MTLDATIVMPMRSPSSPQSTRRDAQEASLTLHSTHPTHTIRPLGQSSHRRAPTPRCPHPTSLQARWRHVESHMPGAAVVLQRVPGVRARAAKVPRHVRPLRRARRRGCVAASPAATVALSRRAAAFAAPDRRQGLRKAVLLGGNAVRPAAAHVVDQVPLDHRLRILHVQRMPRVQPCRLRPRGSRGSHALCARGNGALRRSAHRRRNGLCRGAPAVDVGSIVGRVGPDCQIFVLEVNCLSLDFDTALEA